MSLLLIMLVSQTDKECENVISSIHQNNQLLNIKLIYIDSLQLRNLILNSKSIKVDNIPCLMVVDHKTKNVSKYEGAKLVEEYIQQMITNNLSRQSKQKNWMKPETSNGGPLRGAGVAGVGGMPPIITTTPTFSNGPLRGAGYAGLGVAPLRDKVTSLSNLFS